EPGSPGHPRQVLRRDVIPRGRCPVWAGRVQRRALRRFRSALPRRRIQWSEVRRTMRDPFNRFALRYLTAVVCGLALLLLHGTAQSGLPAVFVPQCPSPWELSKLAFWPVLAAWVLTGRLGRERRTLVRDLPAAVLVP